LKFIDPVIISVKTKKVKTLKREREWRTQGGVRGEAKNRFLLETLTSLVVAMFGTRDSISSSIAAFSIKRIFNLNIGVGNLKVPYV
jgi:hypothetical protein